MQTTTPRSRSATPCGERSSEGSSGGAGGHGLSAHPKGALLSLATLCCPSCGPRYTVRDQLHAYRLASASTGTRGQPVYRCECCKRRVADARQMRVEHVEPSFNQASRWAWCPKGLFLGQGWGGAGDAMCQAGHRALPLRRPCQVPKAPNLLFLQPPQLVKDFTASTALPTPPLDGRVPGSTRRCFSDEAWTAEWRRYHRRNAKSLQLLCMRCIKERAAAAA